MSMHQPVRKIVASLAAGAMVMGTTLDAFAAPARGTTRTSVNHNANRNANVNRNVNANANVNRNVNANVNRNVNVHVDNDYRGGCCYNNVGHAVATTAAVVATAAVVGSIVSAASMPPSCQTTVINGIAYQSCGGTWYQPQYSGSQVTYIVVNPPG
jgi:hypothetical protein